MRKFKYVGEVCLLGHSEVGTIDFLLGGEKIPDFVISLAGMVVSVKEIFTKQNIYSFNQPSITGNDKKNCVDLLNLLFDAMAEQGRKGIVDVINIASTVIANNIGISDMIMTSFWINQKVHTTWCWLYA